MNNIFAIKPIQAITFPQKEVHDVHVVRAILELDELNMPLDDRIILLRNEQISSIRKIDTCVNYYWNKPTPACPYIFGEIYNLPILIIKEKK